MCSAVKINLNFLTGAFDLLRLLHQNNTFVIRKKRVKSTYELLSLLEKPPDRPGKRESRFLLAKMAASTRTFVSRRKLFQTYFFRFDSLRIDLAFADKKIRDFCWQKKTCSAFY